MKYKLPRGEEASDSGFETKAAALAWGRDWEAAIRAGTWKDPNAGKITLSQWIDRWLPLQDVGLSTADNREYLIRRFIRPYLGDELLASLNSEQIIAWERGLPASTGISPRTARSARTVLHDPRRCGRSQAAADPLQPRDQAAQLRPPHRASA